MMFRLWVFHLKLPKHHVELSYSKKAKKLKCNVELFFNVIISLLQYNRTEKNFKGLLSLKEILNKGILFINLVNKSTTSQQFLMNECHFVCNHTLY